MNIEKIVLIWKCVSCNDIQTSDSSERHTMNVCECGKSGIDLEDSYQRGFGNIENISRKIVYKSNKIKK